MKITYLKNCFLLLLFFLVLLLGGTQANAQAPIAGLEGPILAVGTNGLSVMGIAVIVPPGTPISSPTASLTLDQIGGDPLPGRTTPGFIGGTAIVNGTVLPNGNVRATDVFVEPMEGVLIGTITSSTCTNARCVAPGNVLTLLKRPLRPITDARMPAEPVHNEFGFEANLTGANLAGAAASAEGYFAANRFFYFLLEVTGAPLARPAQTEVSIQRAQCREDVDGIQLNLLGAVHDPPTGVVSFDAGTVTGTANTVAVPATVFGTYTFRQTFPGVTSCPASITASFGGASATAALDITPL